ncbi:hypothetical protein V8G54_035875 [Vigna mungo]|uniref:Uncharacterized protein n=1 Tax=Vigna mungo TaxID=3915 RepID=A0AAQ3MFQ3_VIGMU
MVEEEVVADGVVNDGRRSYKCYGDSDNVVERRRERNIEKEEEGRKEGVLKEKVKDFKQGTHNLAYTILIPTPTLSYLIEFYPLSVLGIYLLRTEGFLIPISDLIVGVPLQVPPPLGQRLKNERSEGRTAKTIGDFASEGSRIAPSRLVLSVLEIPTGTFWRPPWGRVANPNGDHEEHGGTTKHQKDDQKQRQRFGINIAASDQHQEFSTKQRLHNLNHHQQAKQLGLSSTR